MRRIFLALTVAALMAVIAAPAQANVVNFDHDFDDDAVFFSNVNSVFFDDLCSPLIDIDLNGCVFGDDDDDSFFFVNDFEFDHDFDFDDDHDFDIDFDHDRGNRH